MYLSAHFALEELLASQTATRQRILNEPDEHEIENLRSLCLNLLEPVRELLGCPLHVTSGFRSETLNRMVRGSKTSAHLDGRAADIIPVGIEVQTAFRGILQSEIPFDQMILEFNSWIHLAIPRPGETPRKSVLVAWHGVNCTNYTEY